MKHDLDRAENAARHEPGPQSDHHPDTRPVGPRLQRDSPPHRGQQEHRGPCHERAPRQRPEQADQSVPRKGDHQSHEKTHHRGADGRQHTEPIVGSQEENNHNNRCTGRGHHRHRERRIRVTEIRLGNDRRAEQHHHEGNESNFKAARTAAGQRR